MRISEENKTEIINRKTSNRFHGDSFCPSYWGQRSTKGPWTRYVTIMFNPPELSSVHTDWSVVDIIEKRLM